MLKASPILGKSGVEKVKLLEASSVLGLFGVKTVRALTESSMLGLSSVNPLTASFGLRQLLGVMSVKPPTWPSNSCCASESILSLNP